MRAFFWRKYDDAALLRAVESALTEEPTLPNPAAIEVTSQAGVVTLRGVVPSVRVKEHLDLHLQHVLARAGLPYAHLVNQLHVE